MKGILKEVKGVLKCAAVWVPVAIWGGLAIGLGTNLAANVKEFYKKNDEFLNSEPVTQQVQQYKIENVAEKTRKIYEANKAFERGEISQDEYFAEIGEVENQEELSDEEIVAKLYENDEQYNALLAEKDKLNSRKNSVFVTLTSTGVVAALGSGLICKKVLDSVDAETNAELEEIKKEYEARNKLEKEDKQVNEVKEEQSLEDTKKKHEDLEPENA